MCVICDRRPKAAGSPYCHTCGNKIQREIDERCAESRWWDGAEYVLLRHGHVVCLMPDGDVWHPVYQGMPNVGSVPVSKLVRLDQFCPQFQRHTIKRFKGVMRPYAEE